MFFRSKQFMFWLGLVAGLVVQSLHAGIYSLSIKDGQRVQALIPDSDETQGVIFETWKKGKLRGSVYRFKTKDDVTEEEFILTAIGNKGPMDLSVKFDAPNQIRIVITPEREVDPTRTRN